MIYKQWNRPYRIVIDYNGALWIDNLHSAIRDIIVYGKDTKILDTQFYLIGLSAIPPIVVNYKNNLDPSLKKREGSNTCQRQTSKPRKRRHPEHRIYHRRIHAGKQDKQRRHKFKRKPLQGLSAHGKMELEQLTEISTFQINKPSNARRLHKKQLNNQKKSRKNLRLFLMAVKNLRKLRPIL